MSCRARGVGEGELLLTSSQHNGVASSRLYPHVVGWHKCHNLDATLNCWADPLSGPGHSCTSVGVSFCRLSGGLTEEDFIGDTVREPLCTCLSKVAAALSALPADSRLVQNPAEFKAAVNSLKVSLLLQQA